jgi:hypothetical protein
MRHTGREIIHSTAGKKAEQELKQARELLEALTKEARMIIATQDKDFRYPS